MALESKVADRGEGTIGQVRERRVVGSIALVPWGTRGDEVRARRSFTPSGGVCLALAALGLVSEVANNRFFDALNEEIAPPDTPPAERIIRTFERVSDWNSFDANRIPSLPARLLARLEHASPVHVSARFALSAGTDKVGPCGALSRSLLILCRRAGFDARKAILYDDDGIPQHTVVEVKLDEEWRVLDPTYGFIWRRPSDGQLATAVDLATNDKLFASILTAHPHYPLDEYTYRIVQHLRWEKLPGLPWVRKRLAALRGEAWTRELRTPYIYDRPGFAVAAIFFTAGLALITLAGPRRAAGTRCIGRM
jgi:hypothetical protein